MDSLWKQKIVLEIDKNRPVEMTLEELAQFDGKDGRPAYVAINGVIYDVTGYDSWAGGQHFDMVAGTDVTEEFRRCHNHTILERLKIVGRLVP